MDLPFAPLTLLAGVNAAGKSTVIQSLVLLHQALGDADGHGVRRSLPLDGPLLSLGTVADVISQDLGGKTFGIALVADDGFQISWTFSGGDDRSNELAAHVDAVEWSPSGRAAQEFLPAAARNAGAGLIDGLISLRYVPADRIGPAEAYPLAEPTRHESLGPRAERAVGTLRWRGLEPVFEELRYPDHSITPPLLQQVEAWLRNLFPGVRIDVRPVAHANLVTLGIRTRDGNAFHRPNNVGFGIPYVLPIVVALLTAPPGGLIILENPEAHLHPRAQVQIARLAARVVAAGRQVIIETHSDHILNAIRVAVARKTLASDNVALHWFEPDADGVITPRRITVDPKGRLSERPEGFFDEIERQLTNLMGE
jgi:predicted ATPase